MFAIEAGDFARGLALNRPLLDVGAFVVRDLALADAELGFQFSVFPIELQDNEGAAFDLGLAIKFVDLLAVKQKFADALRARNFVTRFFVGLDVGVVEKSLAVIDSGKGIADVGFARANGFDLAAL